MWSAFLCRLIQIRMYGRLHASEKKTQNSLVLPMFTEFPLSPLLVSANELSGNVQRPFGIPLKRNNKSVIVGNDWRTNSHNFRFLPLIKK